MKDVATDLRSQENLIILMEFLLAKTFHFFEVKEANRDLPNILTARLERIDEQDTE